MVGVVGSSPIAPTKQNPLCWAVWKGSPKGGPFLRSLGDVFEPFDKGGQFRTAPFKVSQHLVNLRTCAGPLQAASHVGQGTSVCLLMLMKAHQMQSQ